MIRAAVLALGLCAPAAAAQTLSLPSRAVQTAQVVDETGEINLPVAAWDGSNVPSRAFEGRVSRTAFQIRGQLITPAQIVDALRPQLSENGWKIEFECRDEVCGGFDFRFASSALDAPEMYVDLGNYRYLLATRDDGAALALIVSRAGERAFLQTTEITPAAAEPLDLDTPLASDNALESLANLVEADGRAALDDVQFDPGADTLSQTADGALADVAAYLSANSERRYAIVGHTDWTGGLDGNIALSRRRAEAVRRALIDRFDIAADQLVARGVGYLSPRRSNETDDGRRANRRVELVALD